ncbi:MAG: hypothetical protein IJI57_06470 [Flexilinea sp.]|nr:hypothetical protein [Flexilinea sp.]
MANGEIKKEFIVKTYEITTVASSYVSPFSAYAQKNVEITGYRPISVCVVGGASTFCGAVGIVSDNAIKLASNEETTVMVRVIYELK